MSNPKQAREEVEPAQGLAAANFRCISACGFGDAYNSYPHSMAWFRDHLYVGTTRAVLAHRGRWRKQPGGIGLRGEVWPVRTPETAFEIDLCAQIWRYSPLDDVWEKVYTAPLVRGRGGFDVPLSLSFRTMIVFKGRSDAAPALYVPTMGTHQNPEARLLRSPDGVVFEEVSAPGLRFPEPYTPRGVRSLVCFKDLLFTAPAVGAKAQESNTAGFMVIGVNADPARDAWQLACEPGFGNPNNTTVFDMTEFDGHLYVGTMNPNEGFQVWKTTAEGEPPYRWDRVLCQGAYRGQLNQIAMTLRPFKGHLYVGTAIQGGGHDPDHDVGPAAFEILRIDPDDSWDLVVGESRLTPVGLKAPLSGLGPGFGKFAAGYLWSARVHEGWLYVGTFDWLMSLPYVDHDNWPEAFRLLNLENLVHDYGGCDLWRTRDGRSWIPVTQNGFENPFNYGARTMVSTPYGLFIGMANPFGPEVAVMRNAGWRYEANARGGLEIWLGTRNPVSGSKPPEPSPAAFATTTEGMRTTRFGDDPETYAAAIIDDFLGAIGYRHIGYWRSDDISSREACDDLISEVLAFLPEDPKTIVQLGCGRGATTRALQAQFSAEAVIGITAAREKPALEGDVAGLPMLSPMKLTKLKLPSRSADCVVWFAGDEPLGRRDRLVAEAFRVLEPGGRLACFEAVSTKTRLGGRRRRAADGDPLAGISDAYAEILSNAGFEEVRVVDVTERTFEPTSRHLDVHLASLRLAGEIDDEMIEAAKTLLLGSEPMICLLIAARRPPLDSA